MIRKHELTMDLRTRYLGLDLAHPFMPGASPLDGDLDMVLRLEDAGASAIVMHSLFEEDIEEYGPATDAYVEHLLRIKRRVRVPVIASLNGTTAAGWLRYATLIQRGGADALELNVYHIATDAAEDAATVERRVIDIVAVLKESIAIPLAVKLSPFYSALPHLAAQLDRIGADGLVLFNRFYQADIDPVLREPVPALHYSDSSELLLRLRWIAILAGRVRSSLALTGGVHTPIDAVKAVLAGADAVQMVSALMIGGPSALTRVRVGFEQWADEQGCRSIGEMRGLASMAQCENAIGYERANYLQVLRAARRLSPDAGH
jgi:dihydroorotate dehydrogenase (fumarate)